VNGPAADARGSRVVVAWHTMHGPQPQLKVAFSTDGGRRFAAPVMVDSATSLGRPQVMLLQDGSALVLWMVQSKRRVLATVARVAEDGRVSPQVPIALMPRAAGGYPQMARAGDRLLFAWGDALLTKPYSIQIYQARLLPVR
jgi:hypothetical protein